MKLSGNIPLGPSSGGDYQKVKGERISG
jgi:hypothetical protein